MEKPVLWMLLANLRAPSLCYVVPTLTWMAEAAGARLEIYLESERTGVLFAKTGSTVIGGHHFQQFNYLCAAFDVRVIRYGETAVLDSSLAPFGIDVVAEATDPGSLYAAMLGMEGVPPPQHIVVGPSDELVIDGDFRRATEVAAAYVFPEILFRCALGFSARDRLQVRTTRIDLAALPAAAACVDEDTYAHLAATLPKCELVEQIKTDDSLGSLTLRIAGRWQHCAKSVVFADPPAVIAQLASHCRRAAVAIYETARTPAPIDVQVSQYTESVSPAGAATAELAQAMGVRMIVGRQTGDGDIFEWSARGVAIQIIDPNRPAFPVIETIEHRWTPRPASTRREPDDAQLERWADEGRVLSTLIFHSGEVAHNEAMIAMIEMAGWSGLKLGLGTHAARYRTCPQMWELLNIPPERGGAAGLVEPLIHSGGLGVMVESRCPPALLRQHCEEALSTIRQIAGETAAPRGYYAFMDSNLDRLDDVRGDLFEAIAAAGLDYVVSSALPGRNRLLWRSPQGAIAINQTPRVVEGSSPFVRATSPHDIDNTIGAPGPGWLIATFDAPVISFSPYIWREGSRFMQVVDRLRADNRINVLPSTIARYARLLLSRGLLRGPSA